MLIGREDMKLRIFALIILWMVISIIAMGVFHYPVIKNAEFSVHVNRVETESERLANTLSLEINELTIGIEALSLNLDSGAKWLDISSDYLRMNGSVLEVHRYDENRMLVQSQSQQGRQVSLEMGTLEGMFFYQPMIIEQYSREEYLIYFKGKRDYLVFLINLNELFSPKLSSLKGMQGVYDQHLVPVVEVGEDLNERDFLENAADESVGYVNNQFYAINRVSIENMTFNTMVVRFDQTYQKAVRLYIVRFIILSLVLTAIGFLIAWRIIKTYRHALLTDNLGKLSEIKSIKKNITLAINHMGMAAKSFDDINILKEELETLYEDLIEGVDHDEEREETSDISKQD